jgi:hypothetical protein
MDLSKGLTLESGMFLAMAFAKSKVCENPRFLTFVGDDGTGTNKGSFRAVGQLVAINCPIKGTRLVIPDSLTAFMIRAGCSLYRVTAKPFTEEISKVSCDV